MGKIGHFSVMFISVPYVNVKSEDTTLYMAKSAQPLFQAELNSLFHYVQSSHLLFIIDLCNLAQKPADLLNT